MPGLRENWKSDDIRMTVFEKYLGEHITIGRLTIYGFNAMHVAFQFWTKKYGYICFHPTIKMRGHWWRWYFYTSPNATPWASTFAIGPGIDPDDKAGAPLRKWLLGHNYNTNLIERSYWGHWEPKKNMIQSNYPE